MEKRLDFLNWLDQDTSLRVLSCLEDPSDLVRITAVSRFWRHFAISNGLLKQLCLRLFPQLASVDRVVEASDCGVKKQLEVGSSKFAEWENLEREHRAYTFFARASKSFPLRSCITDAVSASSTDNDPDESIQNTLEPRDRVVRSPSYWSSKGQKDPAVPETLVYKLGADICLVSDINIQPFQAYFQFGFPIYSAKSVRFHFGHPKRPTDTHMGESCDVCADHKFVWTYTSPEFPMAQENRLQNFKLPAPVLCIGGYVKVELLGRVQRQEMDGLFYICVSFVQVVGRPLSSAFGVDIVEPGGKIVLKALNYTQPTVVEDEPLNNPDGFLRLQGRLELIVNMLRGHGVEFAEIENMWNEEDESDEEFDL